MPAPKQTFKAETRDNTRYGQTAYVARPTVTTYYQAPKSISHYQETRVEPNQYSPQDVRSSWKKEPNKYETVVSVGNLFDEVVGWVTSSSPGKAQKLLMKDQSVYEVFGLFNEPKSWKAASVPASPVRLSSSQPKKAKRTSPSPSSKKQEVSKRNGNDDYERFAMPQLFNLEHNAKWNRSCKPAGRVRWVFGAPNWCKFTTLPKRQVSSQKKTFKTSSNHQVSSSPKRMPAGSQKKATSPNLRKRHVTANTNDYEKYANCSMFNEPERWMRSCTPAGRVKWEAAFAPSWGKNRGQGSSPNRSGKYRQTKQGKGTYLKQSHASYWSSGENTRSIKDYEKFAVSALFDEPTAWTRSLVPSVPIKWSLQKAKTPVKIMRSRNAKYESYVNSPMFEEPASWTRLCRPEKARKWAKNSQTKRAGESLNKTPLPKLPEKTRDKTFIADGYEKFMVASMFAEPERWVRECRTNQVVKRAKVANRNKRALY